MENLARQSRRWSTITQSGEGSPPSTRSWGERASSGLRWRRRGFALFMRQVCEKLCCVTPEKKFFSWVCRWFWWNTRLLHCLWRSGAGWGGGAVEEGHESLLGRLHRGHRWRRGFDASNCPVTGWLKINNVKERLWFPSLSKYRCCCLWLNKDNELRISAAS